MSRAADTFLNALRDAIGDGSALEVIADDPSGFAAALRDEPEALSVAIDAVANVGEEVATVQAKISPTAFRRARGVDAASV